MFPAIPRKGLLRVGAILALCSIARASEPAPREPISAVEAERILRNAQDADIGTGSYRTRTVQKKGDRTTTTTQLMHRSDPKSALLIRVERNTVFPGPTQKHETNLTITTAEGIWYVIGSKAVLAPHPIHRGKAIEAVRKIAGGGETPRGGEATNEERVARQAITIAKHRHLTGERVREGEKSLVKITRSYDAEAQRAAKELAEEQLANVKKGLSLGKRLLISTVLAAKGGIDEMIPAREEFTIDEAQGRLVLTESYNSEGKRISRQRAETPPEKIDDLPPETFEPPRGVEQLRPATIGEAAELVEKLQKADKKANENRN